MEQRPSAGEAHHRLCMAILEARLAAYRANVADVERRLNDAERHALALLHCGDPQLAEAIERRTAAATNQRAA